MSSEGFSLVLPAISSTVSSSSRTNTTIPLFDQRSGSVAVAQGVAITLGTGITRMTHPSYEGSCSTTSSPLPDSLLRCRPSIPPMKADRAGARPLREARNRTLAVLRRPRIALAGVVTTVILVIGEVGLFIGAKAADLPISGEVIAFFLGATVASVPWALWSVALTMGGGASWAAGGAMEEQTGHVLANLGQDWVVFHNLPFLDGRGPWSRLVDVDHVAVGPSGILVVETKFTAADLDVGETRRAKQK